MKLINKPWLYNSLIPGLIFAAIAFVILWQMLLPGYILTLDMIFVPKIGNGFIFVGPDNVAPLRIILVLSNYLLPSWAIQKIILWLMFFLMGFLTFKFLPLKNSFASYWAAIFYMANPFVYERFLAGQWLMLFAYALLPPVARLIIEFFKKPEKTIAIICGLMFSVVAIFSLHLTAMILIIFGILVFSNLVYSSWQKNVNHFKNISISFFIFLLVFGLLSSYWIVDLLNNNNLTQFNQQHFEAFATVANPKIGLLTTVVGLYGFWAEQQPWSLQFIQPNYNLFFWIPLLLLLLAIIGFGVFRSFVQKNTKENIFFMIAGIIGLIFALGINAWGAGRINQWFFDNIIFWSGFRDSGKWVMLLILSYAYFGGLGAGEIFGILRKYFNHTLLVIGLLAVSMVYVYPIWGGFSRQLQPVWYPSSWHQVVEIIDQQGSAGRILFLPWHQYYSLAFNHNILTINPAQAFFGHRILQSYAAELGDIESQIGEPLAAVVDDILAKNSINSPDETVILLANSGITHILVSHEFFDLQSQDLNSLFESDFLKVVFSSPDLTFFEIMLE